MELVSGLTLSERFYAEVVRPILDVEFPGLPHAAALIGYGSDVLGYDTARSTDHERGPRLLLFLQAADHAALKERIAETLRRKLPYAFLGYPTHFTAPDAEGTRRIAAIASGPVNHKIEIYTVPGFFSWWLGFDPSGEVAITDWLSPGRGGTRA